MISSSVFRRVLAGASFLALAPLVAQAQTSPTQAPPRLPANTSQTSQIPAGVDTGSPTTSGNLPLGTPVPPDESSDQVDERTHSAAARAAARLDPLTRTGVPLTPSAPLVGAAVIREASRPAGQSSHPNDATSLSCAYGGDAAFRQSMSRCTALTDRGARSACAEGVMESRRDTSAPVGLPGSGFVGSSASPQTRATLGPSSARSGCV